MPGMKERVDDLARLRERGILSGVVPQGAAVVTRALVRCDGNALERPWRERGIVPV